MTAFLNSQFSDLSSQLSTIQSCVSSFGLVSQVIVFYLFFSILSSQFFTLNYLFFILLSSIFYLPSFIFFLLVYIIFLQFLYAFLTKFFTKQSLIVKKVKRLPIFLWIIFTFNWQSYKKKEQTPWVKIIKWLNLIMMIHMKL